MLCFRDGSPQAHKRAKAKLFQARLDMPDYHRRSCWWSSSSPAGNIGNHSRKSRVIPKTFFLILFPVELISWFAKLGRWTRLNRHNWIFSLLFCIWNIFRSCSYGLELLCGVCWKPQNPGVVVLGPDFLKNRNQMQTHPDLFHKGSPRPTLNMTDGLENAII